MCGFPWELAVFLWWLGQFGEQGPQTARFWFNFLYVFFHTCFLQTKKTYEIIDFSSCFIKNCLLTLFFSKKSNLIKEHVPFVMYSLSNYSSNMKDKYAFSWPREEKAVEFTYCPLCIPSNWAGTREMTALLRYSREKSNESYLWEMKFYDALFCDQGLVKTF